MCYLAFAAKTLSGLKAPLNSSSMKLMLVTIVSMAAILVQALNLLAYAQNSTSLGQEWGVILGADRSVKEAEKEIIDNTRTLGQKPRTYMCNGWVRTIAVYRSRQDALKALRKVRAAGSPYSPYIVSLWQWCPGKKLL